MRTTALVAAVLVCTLAFSADRTSAYADKITKTNTVKSSSTVKDKVLINNPKTISVSPGEDLSEIAGIYNTTVSRLFDVNLNIVNPNLIYPNETLVIPNANETLKPRPLPSESPVTVSSPTPAVVTPASAAISSAIQPVTTLTSVPATTTNVPSSTAPQASTNSSNENVWYELAQCESGGDWSIDTGNGFYGGLQFTLASWQAVGGVGYPNQASPGQQIAAAEQLQSTQGWGAWPACSAELGL